MFRYVFLLLLVVVAFTAPAQAAQHVALLLDQDCANVAYGKTLAQAMQHAQQRLGITGDVWIAPRGEEEARLLALAKGGYDLIIVPPALHMALAGNAGNFPKVRFCALDGRVKAPHILSITFAEAEAALLAGAAAALLTRTAMPDMNNARVIGWVGRTDTRDTRGVLQAFIKGTQLVDPTLSVLTAFTGAPATDDEFYAAAKGLYARGASFVAAAESVAAAGVLRAARDSGGYAIGVDVDQPQAPQQLLFSRYKALEDSLLGCIQAVTTHTFQGGVWERHLKDGGIGITDLTTWQKRWGKPVPDELAPLLAALRRDLEQGTIKLASPPRSGCDCLNDE